ncbi:MAG: cold shock domain-containing protein [Cyclobacteriaceae bacterium]|jgi:cold shock CspA family protein|nr:cold shock domain-containing protein [Cyclobacteriaceae bacterium]
MARSQESFSKKEFEKKKLQKRKEKEQRKEDRKSSGAGTQSWEDMIAYVDENGNITSTPPDPAKKSSIKADDIVIGSRNIIEHQANELKTGKVTFFNSAKGFGFIEDAQTRERIFVHSNDLQSMIKENDRVSYETERGFKGFKAVNVKVIS